jgi:hypothetical protein
MAKIANLAAVRKGHPALLAEELPHGQVRCHTCLRRCLIPPGGRGWCRTRENRDGLFIA